MVCTWQSLLWNCPHKQPLCQTRCPPDTPSATQLEHCMPPGRAALQRCLCSAGGNITIDLTSPACNAGLHMHVPELLSTTQPKHTCRSQCGTLSILLSIHKVLIAYGQLGSNKHTSLQPSTVCLPSKGRRVLSVFTSNSTLRKCSRHSRVLRPATAITASHPVPRTKHLHTHKPL